MSMVPSTPLDTSPTSPARNAEPPADVARSVVAVLRDLEAALSPVIGHRGVAALCQRSLHLSGRRHAWLGEVPFDPGAAVDLERVAQLLAGQPGDVARAAGDALIQGYHDLLISLLGASLTHQLVGGIWPGFADAPAAQDKTP
jgi:hypothetical protein